MSRSYTHVQELLTSVLAMKGEGYTYRQIANRFSLEKEQIKELCKRARRKQKRIKAHPQRHSKYKTVNRTIVSTNNQSPQPRSLTNVLAGAVYSRLAHPRSVTSSRKASCQS